MNKDIKDKWVRALRSGEYRQGVGYLKAAGRYCCLGVLCDLHSKETGIPWDGLNSTDLCSYIDKENVQPLEVIIWSGLLRSSVVKIEGCERFLEAHNDAGRTFEEIAKAIDEQL